MGVDTRKPALPAPTDSSTFETSGASVTGTDLATDVSRRTEKSSYEIPDDGSPITISTHKRGDKTGGKLSRHHQSQTSLLIEYFEGGKEGATAHTRRPSVRVKVTPSAAKKVKDQHDHIVVSETNGTKRPSYSRRISLGAPGSPKQILDNQSVSSLTSLANDSNVSGRAPPVEIEVLDRGQGSDLSGASESKETEYIVPTSDISSMPPDSMLEGNSSVQGVNRRRSRSVSRENVAPDNTTLKAPSRRRSRSLSRERITQKVIEKLGNKPIEATSSKQRKQSDKSRSRSVSKELLTTEPTKSARRRSGKHREDESVTTAESSLLSNSVDPRRQSTDQYSFRSGTSKSSINNPKLLETVEDAIRRLILPELKELKKDQKVQPRRNKVVEPSDISTSSMSREDVTRRVSKRVSSPDIKKPKVVRRDSRDSEELLSSGSRRRRRRHRDADSLSDRSYRRRESEDSTIVEDEKAHRKRGKEHRVRDAAAGALLGGALTAAALKHHDSKSSMDTRERRKKRSKSRSSRATSVPEVEEIFEKHDVPPMPMRSDIDSELTRTSLLSDQTVSTASPTHREVREVMRGSPREVLSPGSATPTRSPRTPLTPVNLQQGLGTRHGNLSTGDLSIHKNISDHSVQNEKSPSLGGDNLATAAAAAATGAGASLIGHHLSDYERERQYEKNLHTSHPIRRGLSPIQSVASVRDSVQESVSEPPRDSMYHSHSTGSLSSLGKEKTVQQHRASYESLSTAPSPTIAKSKRPEGINLEKPREILGQHDFPPDSQHYSDSTTEKDVDAWYDEQHRENDKYRDSVISDDQYRESYASSDPKIDVRHLTNYTDDSLDSPNIDKVTAGQQVGRGFGANPEYVHTPVAVESAVASLYDPSVLDVRSSQSPYRSYNGSLERQPLESPRSPAQSAKDQASSGRGSPLKQEYLPSAQAEDISQMRIDVNSPPQSVAESLEEPQMGVSGVPNAEDPMPEIGHGLDSAESDITTNPSVIQGPIGGVILESRDHWPYNPTPPRSKGDALSHDGDERDLGAGEAAMLGAGAGAGLGAMARHRGKGEEDIAPGYGGHYGQFSPGGDSFTEGRNAPLSPGMKDEGYISAANPRSPGSLTPDIRRKPVGATAKTGEDPFLGDGRPASGYSHGMASPLYDSATGRGIDRIQSKDVVALMDHLTVRDAQRNARDTEILVTLVRSAAEMRNSFEDMKRFIAEQNDLNMDTSDRQHEKTQKIIGGPRPQPQRPVRKLSTEDEEDLPTKRRNVFRRALRGLGSKNSGELQNIEAMLVQLLGEVEGLRADQERRPAMSRSQQGSYNSADHLRESGEDGYEPEGQAGTSSTGNRSGFLSTNSSRQMGDTRGYGSGRRESENRISTVLEGDEDLERPVSNQQGIPGQQPIQQDPLDSPRDLRDSQEDTRGQPVPFSPQEKSSSAPQSSENTPRMSDGGKGRKHKSSSSSFFPKISRWSKTTASSVGDTFRSSVQNSARKERPSSEVSRSGSDLGRYEYDANGDDRSRSNDSIDAQQENRPPSPLIPSQVSDNPKYQAHRNSINLQHPQPRQGPTGRYQNHLENEAQNYMLSPTSPSSDRWEGELPGLLPMSDNTNKSHSNPRHSYGANPGHLSPISDGGYSESSSAMMELGEKEASQTSLNAPPPPRPPKIKDDGPLVPDRPPKLAMSPGNVGRNPTYADHVAAARAGSPAYHSGSSPTVRSASGQTPPSRKPGGPRPITSSGQYSPGNLNAIKKHRYRGSPNHVEGSSSEDLGY